MKNPIDSVVWVKVDELKSNDYNPNYVYGPEIKLLERSIITQGWIQPILAAPDGTIIDGFHRATLVRSSAKVRALTDGRVPVVYLDIPEPERMMLSIRINRAKGSHIAQRMSVIVKRLVEEFDYSIVTICKAIGATKDEVDLLLQDGVFKSLKINEHRYSKSWVPGEKKRRKKDGTK